MENTAVPDSASSPQPAAGTPAPVRDLSRARAGLCLAVIVALAVAIGVVGITWGLPNAPNAWAPDELTPASVEAAARRRFAQGWYETYPPMHYYVLSVVDRLVPPFGADDETARERQYFARYVAQRGVSVAMGAVLVVLVYRLTRELALDRTAALLAALQVPLTPLYAYYSKVANVDLPYTCWYALALLAFARALRRHRTGDYLLLALAAALTIGTKDQAYALFIGMPFALALAARASARVPTGLALRRLALAGVAGLALLLAIDNVVFNWAGFRDHVVLLLGPVSHEMRRFQYTLRSQADMTVLALEHLWFAMNPLGFVAAAGGVLVVAARWPSTARAAALLVPVATYWLFFIVPILYHLDRFFWPVIVTLHACSGFLFAEIRRVCPGRAATAIVVAASLCVGLPYALSVNWSMLADTRYDAERWLQEHLDDDDRVLGIGPKMYLPRVSHGGYERVERPLAEQVLEDRPDVIVISEAWDRGRFWRDPEARAFFERLQGDELPYRVAYRGRGRPVWNLLATRGLSTNLDKVNPEITIWRRTEARGAEGTEGEPAAAAR
jgi:hypothetical protein